MTWPVKPQTRDEQTFDQWRIVSLFSPLALGPVFTLPETWTVLLHSQRPPINGTTRDMLDWEHGSVSSLFFWRVSSPRATQRVLRCRVQFHPMPRYSRDRAIVPDTVCRSTLAWQTPRPLRQGGYKFQVAAAAVDTYTSDKYMNNSLTSTDKIPVE